MVPIENAAHLAWTHPMPDDKSTVEGVGTEVQRRHWQTSELATIHGQAVVAIAQSAMHFAVDHVSDRPHRAIAECHVQTAGMGASKSIGPLSAGETGCVLRWWVICIGGGGARVRFTHHSQDVVLGPRHHAPIVAPFRAVQIVVGIEKLFSEHIGGGSSVANHRHRNLAVQIADARNVGGVFPGKA